MSWMALWTLVFFVTLATFAVISALIAIKGVDEIKELFRELDASRDRREK